MKDFGKKRLIEIAQVNERVGEGRCYVMQCERDYKARVEKAAEAIERSKASIVLVSGPSASGKTTTSHKLRQAIERRGHRAFVVSLDNYYKKITDYPKHPDGTYDMEHMDALDTDQINSDLKRLIDTGACDIPTYDFVVGTRAKEVIHICAGEGDRVIVEGIHALNPELTRLVPTKAKYGVYVGLRTEYAEGGRRVMATRDLRISRRMVRDYYFRGRSVQDTLGVWNRLKQGEERWIKPFRSQAHMLLDTSFSYEPAVFALRIKKLTENLELDGEYRDDWKRLNDLFMRFCPLQDVLIPPDSMLREFLGHSQVGRTEDS